MNIIVERSISVTLLTDDSLNESDRELLRQRLTKLFNSAMHAQCGVSVAGRGADGNAPEVMLTFHGDDCPTNGVLKRIIIHTINGIKGK